MNGSLRTPKLYDFNLLILWLNTNHKTNIELHQPDTSSMEKNGWLSGFFDADGHFKIRLTEKKEILFNNFKKIKKGRLEVRISLEQRKYHSKTNQPFQSVMEDIVKFFEAAEDFNNNLNNNKKLRESRHSKQGIDRYYWIIEITSLPKLAKFVNYLNIYPLFSSKNNDFKDWYIVYKMMCNKEHLKLMAGSTLLKTKSELKDENSNFISKIKIIKANMNKNRISFDWSHLDLLKK